MKYPMKRGISALLVLVMIVSLFSGLTLPVHAASYPYNWGSRGTTATELSDAAGAFYADNGISYETLAAYAGASDVASVPSSPLYSQLQALMVDNHTTITSYADTRDMYQYTDCQNGGGKISSFYSGAAIGPAWDSGATWNREHVWPNSKGLEGDDENDIMMLRPTAVSENTSRGNTAYGESSGYYHPNSVSGGSYDLRGDVARITLYVYTRWGNTNYMWGTKGVIESKEVLLSWIEQDPVDTWEMGRNDVVQSITGTRNVFVDYPELAFLLFDAEVPGSMTTPSGKAGEKYTLTATVNDPAMGSTTVSGKTITAIAADGFYAHGFEVTSGTATVKRQGDDFLITAFSDCTVQINFKAKTLAKVSYLNNGNTLTTASALTGDTIILSEYIGTAPEGYTFLGWSDAAVSHSTDIPAYYLPGDTYGVTGDTKLYALFTYMASGGEGSGVWTLVTDASTLAAGQQIVFAYKEAGHVSGALNTSKHILDVATATFDGDTIASMADSAQVFTLGGGAGAWTFSNESGNLLGATGSKTSLYFGSGTTTWTIAISGGNATIANTNSSYGKLQYNTGYPRFANYSSSQALPQLYVLDTGTEVPHYTTTSAVSGGMEEVESIYYGRAQLAKLTNATALLYAYDQIAAGVESCAETINIYNGTNYLTPDEFHIVRDAYIRDYAHHFWLDNAWGYTYPMGDPDKVISAVPSYIMTGTALETAKAAFNAEAAEILSGITPSMSDYEKELYIHDTLASRIVYEDVGNAHNAYGALVDGIAVCEGYAEAFQYLLQQVDIQSFIITGISTQPGTESTVGHAWNAVNIGGKWYHVDLTWDDQGENLFHAYFNVSDSRILEGHAINAAGYALPTCNSEDAFYFTGKDTLLTTYTADSVAALLKNNEGKVHVYVPNGEVSDFITWLDENILTIAQKAGVTGGFSYGYFNLGRELILIMEEAPCEHTFENDICKNCGITGGYCGASTNEGGEESVTWTLVDGVLTVSGKGAMRNGKAWSGYGNQIVSADIKFGVKTIGDQAFYGCSNLTSVTISDSVVGIGDWAFASCTSLTSIEIPDSVTRLGKAAFQNCTGLTSVTIGNSVNKIDEYTFNNCNNLESVTIGNSVKSIGEAAFFNCWKLEGVEIPDSVISIGKSAFRSCVSLAGVVKIPASVTSIGDIAFNECDSLTAIVVDEANPNYSSDQQGVLFNKDKTNLICCPGGKTGDYKIPTSVTNIVKYAFAYCDGLTNVQIPTSVTSIGVYAFAYSDGLTKMQIPASVTSIGTAAFNWCYGLKEITFEGDAPSIGNGVFTYVTATAYYPADNATWTDEVKQNYGGTITWVPYYFCEHDWESATCTAPETCKNCSMTRGSATGHTPNIPAATETEDQICVTCGTVLATKTGHICGTAHFTLVQANGATCTAAGNVEHYLCSCGKFYEDINAAKELTSVVIPALGHDPSTVAAYDPTCTIDGKTEGSYCARCSTVLVEQSTIPALGHNPVTDDAVAPTCTTAGKTEGSHCDRCNAVLAAQETVDALGHTEETVPAVAPTCTSTGLTEGKKCSVCNEVLTAQITVDALGHNEVIDAAVAATCQTTGLTEGKHCDVCHEILIAQTEVEKLPHTEEIIPAVEATCTSTGLTEGKKCAVCNETITAQTTVPATGHTEEVIPAVAPTCTTTGLTEGSKCGICGTTLTAQTVVNALGHTEDIIPAVAPTCTAAGLTEGKKCTVCGIATVAQTTVPATGHSWSDGTCDNCGTACDHSYDENGVCTICGDGCDHSYETVVKQPTCTEQGYTTYTCSVCGNTYNGDYVDSLGHTWQDATCTAPKTCTVCNTTEGEPNGHNYSTAVTAPTCTAQGYTTHTCTACGDSYTDTYTDETGHTAGVPEEENRNEATCTAEGSYESVTYCSVCGAEMSRLPNTIPAKGHSYASAVTAPTCTEQGYTVHTCTACGDSYTDSYTPATGHAYGEWETVTAATCTEKGEKKQTCACGDTLTEEIPALGHTWQATDATTMECTVCGEKQSGYRIELDALAVAEADYAFVDGKKYPITKNGDEAFVNIMHTDATNLVIYTFNDPNAADPHTQYPTGMRVWMLKYENGAYTATHVPEFDNLLQYSGSSIRIVGVKGIRMITSIDKDTRAALIKGGLAGYTLVEYGTALAWASDLNDENPLVLGKDYTKSNFAYKRGEADPIFNRTGNLIQYTNVLVGFSDDQCIPDIVMRSYIILEDAEGNQITLYGGEVVRNIGYIAWQNRLVFNPGNAAYDYVWNIIHHVYGDVYDEDYKG